MLLQYHALEISLLLKANELIIEEKLKIFPLNHSSGYWVKLEI